MLDDSFMIVLWAVISTIFAIPQWVLYILAHGPDAFFEWIANFFS